MVYRPFDLENKSPSEDKNKWNIHVTGAFKLRRDRDPAELARITASVAEEIDYQIKAVGKELDYKITRVDTERGQIQVACDPQFGELLKTLPNVEMANHTVYAELMDSAPAASMSGLGKRLQELKSKRTK